jgi:hypothetical protein
VLLQKHAIACCKAHSYRPGTGSQPALAFHHLASNLQTLVSLHTSHDVSLLWLTMIDGNILRQTHHCTHMTKVLVHVADRPEARRPQPAAVCKPRIRYCLPKEDACNDGRSQRLYGHRPKADRAAGSDVCGKWRAGRACVHCSFRGSPHGATHQ